MDDYAFKTYKALFDKHMDETMDHCATALMIGAWTPSDIDEQTEDFEMTNERFKEYLMMVLGRWVDEYLENNLKSWQSDNHDCFKHAVHKTDDEGMLGDYYECGKCGEFLQVG